MKIDRGLAVSLPVLPSRWHPRNSLSCSPSTDKIAKNHASSRESSIRPVMILLAQGFGDQKEPRHNYTLHFLHHTFIIFAPLHCQHCSQSEILPVPLQDGQERLLSGSTRPPPPQGWQAWGVRDLPPAPPQLLHRSSTSPVELQLLQAGEDILLLWSRVNVSIPRFLCRSRVLCSGFFPGTRTLL